MLPSQTGNVTDNIQKATDFCTKAKGMGADIALMPEMWNVGMQRGCGICLTLYRLHY